MPVDIGRPIVRSFPRCAILLVSIAKPFARLRKCRLSIYANRDRETLRNHTAPNYDGGNGPAANRVDERRSAVPICRDTERRSRGEASIAASNEGRLSRSGADGGGRLAIGGGFKMVGAAAARA